MKVIFEGKEYEADEKLSRRIFTNWEFLSRPEYDFTNKVIYDSCFYNENPDSDIFPLTTQNVTFINCNLNNIVLDPSFTVLGGSHKRIKCQNDLNDWLLDDFDNPVTPLDVHIYEKLKLPIPSPLDIPKNKVAERIDLIKVATEEKLRKIKKK